MITIPLVGTRNRSESRVQRAQQAQPSGHLRVLVQGADPLVLIAQPGRAEVRAEDVRLGEFRARVEAFQHELVVPEGGGEEEAVVQDAQDEGEEAVRDGCEGEEGAGGEGGEDLDEDLRVDSNVTFFSFHKLPNERKEREYTSLGRESRFNRPSPLLAAMSTLNGAYYRRYANQGTERDDQSKQKRETRPSHPI